MPKIEGLNPMQTDPTKNPYVVTGTIQLLHTTPSKINLLSDLQKGAGLTGAAAVLGDMPGMAANAASLALYDGEDVEHGAIVLNDQLYIGTFECLEDLQEGDEVSLVVSTVEGVKARYIHAILRPKDQLLWMPYARAYTRFCGVMREVKLSGLLLVGTWLMIASVYFFDSSPITPKDIHDILIYGGGGGFIMMTIVTLLSCRGLLDEGEEAEEVYEALGVPKFKYFRVTPFSLLRLAEDPTVRLNCDRKNHIFRFDQALEKHKQKWFVRWFS
jgi:hypothetical protein